MSTNTNTNSSLDLDFDIEAPHEPRQPDSIEDITCQKCSTVFRWEFFELFPELVKRGKKSNIDLYRPDHCEDCIPIMEAEMQARTASKRLDEFMQEVHKNIPPRFQNTDLDHPGFNRDKWERIQHWRPSPEKPWITLISESGKCKTRMAYLLALDLIREKSESRDGRPVRHQFITANQFSATAQNQFNDTFVEGTFTKRTVGSLAKEELNRYAQTEILFFDDLGKGRLTPAVAEALFGLLDWRHAKNLPTIITANSKPEQIVAGLSEDLAGPLAGRITECSKIYQF
jgi:hypothetical protein